MTDNYDSSASGYVTEDFEGITRTFTEVKILHTSEVNIVAKGKRYGRWWLLKGLRQEVAGDAGYRQRLRKELEILMQLQHPNIVSAVGMEPVDGLGECIVMEFLDGTTLKEWLRGTTTRRQRRKVAWELTEAVGYAHAKGIVHRDLKPSNILITVNGESVKLLDFGLADADSYAILKQPAGTLRYISPEQVQTAVADVRNDIYSLGVVLGEMRLGYGRIVKKCLLPLEKRYRNVAELQGAMRAQDRWRVRMAVAAVALCVILLAGLVGIQTMRLRDFASQATENRTEQERLNATVTLLTDSLDRMSVLHHQLANEQEQLKGEQEQLKGEQEQQLLKRQRVEEAVSKGKAEIDRVIKDLGLKQHFDTLSNFVYLDDELLTDLTNAYEISKAFVERIEPDYTERELSEISNRLTDYYSKCAKYYLNRYNQMKAEYDRKIMQGD